MPKVDVVVGGGIAGLLAALLLSEQKKHKVILIERETQVGGLLRCFNYGEHGVFDYGMHNMYETGISALDELLFGLLPDSDWQILEGPARDLAGVVFNGTVQYNSPFPDLRLLPQEQWDSCVLDFFGQMENPRHSNFESAWDDILSRLGRSTADLIDTVLLKQFGKRGIELAPFATRLTTLSRVVMFSEEPFANLMTSSLIRDRLAWPEQRTLPAIWGSGRKAYYPKKYGIYRVVDALLERLKDAGVEIITGAQVQSLEITNNQVNKLIVSSVNGDREIASIEQFIWTSGLPGISQLLGMDLSCYRFDPPRKTVVVNLLLRQPPNMRDLYYLYCYESGCHTFRVTNFAAYCEGAHRPSGWPIAVELLVDAPLPDSEDLKNIALNELKQFGVITTVDEVTFAAVEPLSSGFPMPSVNNFNSLSDMRKRVGLMNLSNLTLLGILSDENIFFQRDVLAQTWLKIMQQDNLNG